MALCKGLKLSLCVEELSTGMCFGYRNAHRSTHTDLAGIEPKMSERLVSSLWESQLEHPVWMDRFTPQCSPDQRRKALHEPTLLVDPVSKQQIA